MNICRYSTGGVFNPKKCGMYNEGKCDMDGKKCDHGKWIKREKADRLAGAISDFLNGLLPCPGLEKILKEYRNKHNEPCSNRAIFSGGK